MPKLSVQQIRERAIEIIQQSPGGIRYSQLIGRILQQSPETPKNTYKELFGTWIDGSLSWFTSRSEESSKQKPKVRRHLLSHLPASCCERKTSTSRSRTGLQTNSKK